MRRTDQTDRSRHTSKLNRNYIGNLIVKILKRIILDWFKGEEKIMNNAEKVRIC